MSGDILTLDGVGHRFGGFTVLRSVRLSVKERGLIGLIGPNGSGKTTLFNIISGYLPLQAGTISFEASRSPTNRCRPATAPGWCAPSRRQRFSSA